MGGGVFREPGPSAPFLHPQSALLAQNGTGSLPRNLAATLQDIETKRQLALQQKGEWLLSQGPWISAPRPLHHTCHGVSLL